MENENRRIAIKQMLLYLGGGLVLNSCTNESSKDSQTLTRKPLSAIHVKANEISKPADGIIAGAPKIRSEHTNGQFCCQEITVLPKHAGPPPHLHKDLDEIMFVIEGTVHVMVGDSVTEINAGDYHLRPHGIIHTFWNSSDSTARFLDMYPNQDFVSFFEEIVRIDNTLKAKGLTQESDEGKNLLDNLMEQFGLEMFPDQFPPILEKYGLNV
jgi:mannose-6-phosphate isomerase-like protein (cupin superfamily)